MTLCTQYYAQVMEDHDEYLRTRPPGMPKRPAVRHVLTLRPTQLLLHQTLMLGLFDLPSRNEGNFYLNPEVKYNVTDPLWAAVATNLFGGPRRTEFGQFEGNSILHVVIRYAF